MGKGVKPEDGLYGSASWRVVQDGLHILRVHCRKYRAKAYVPENKSLPSTRIAEDMKDSSQRLFAAVVSGALEGSPVIEDMPVVVFPTW